MAAKDTSQKNTLTFIITFIVLVVYYNSFYSPRAVDIQGKREELLKIQNAVNSFPEKMKTLDSLQKSCTVYIKKIDHIKSVLPKSNSEFEKNILALAGQSSLEVRTMTPGKEEKTPFIITKSMQLNMTGTFEALYTFIKKLELTYKTAAVSQLTAASSGNLLTISCAVSFSTLNEPEEKK